MLQKHREAESRAQYEAAALTAWLLGAGEKKSFPEFLIYLGITEKANPISAENKKAAIERANRIAEKVMRLDKARNQSGKRNI